MKPSCKFLLPLAAIAFVVLLAPQSAMAGIANCPTEPKANEPIATGDVFQGTNCVLKSTGDTDSFVFNGNKGETYQVATALNGAFGSNICLTIRNSSFKVIFATSCTGVGFAGPSSVVQDQPLTATDTYTIDITETANATQEYAVSLERLNPAPPNAEVVKLATEYAGDIAALSDSNAFIFTGATTGEYEVSASLPGTVTANICMSVYSPTGALVTPTLGTQGGCTGVGFAGPSTIMIDFTPTVNGTYMAFVTAAGNDATQSYTLEVSCLAGVCPGNLPPSCTLADTLSYNPTTSTLTMNFTVGATYGTIWNAWLTDQTTMTRLFSTAQPVTVPPANIVKTTTLAPNKGEVGVISTLTTTTKGIACSSLAKVATGTP